MHRVPAGRSPSAHRVRIGVLEQQVDIDCPDATVHSAVMLNYAAMVDPPWQPRAPDLQYRITREAEPPRYRLLGPAHGQVDVTDVSGLLFHLEKDLTVALQLRRPDLLFFHAAALEWGGKAYLFAGASGHGKSTTTWGLLHHGFRYLSDELSPVALDAMQVHPYPRALCLKRSPPTDYPLPSAGVGDHGDTLHVAATAMPQPPAAGPCEIAGVVFVRYDSELPQAAWRETSSAQACTQLYVNTLNARAHPHLGLDAVARIAERVPCYALDAADLRSTCDTVVRQIVRH